MTVQSTITSKTFYPGGAMAAQSLAGLVFASAADLLVWTLDDAGALDLLLAIDEHYVLTGNGQAGAASITPLSAWDSGVRWYVERRTEITQPEKFNQLQPLSSEAIERGLDRLTKIAQERGREIDGLQGRSLKVPVGELAPTIPPLAGRAGKFMAFDADGNAYGAQGTGADGALREDLASEGASLVGFKDRSVEQELLRTVYADHYGVIADYDVESDTGTDDTLSWYRAFTVGLGGGPGRVILRRGGRSLINGVLNVPHSVTIEAESGRTFMGLDGFDANSGDIYIGPSGKITLGNSSGLRRVVAFRKGIEFGITSAQVATQFQGDSIILRDSTWDHCFEDVVIAGFMNGPRSELDSGSNQCNRTRFVGRVMIDCQKAVRIYNAFDIPILDALEGWPLVTYASAAEPNGEQLKRTGPFVYLHGVNDWTKLHVPFNYGAKIGFRITDAGSCTLIAAGSDYPYQATPDGSVGFVLDGASWENRLLFPQAAARDTGIYVASTSPLLALHIYGANLWECRVNGIAVVQGNVQITGGSIRSSFTGSVGIQTGPSAGNVDVDGMDFRNLSTALANDNSSVKLRHRNCRFTNVTTPVLNPYRPVIASAAVITPNGQDTTFFLTGTSNIGTINNPEAYVGLGPVNFLISNAPGAAGPTFLTGGNIAILNNFNTKTGDVVQLVSNGTGWSVSTRSNNS